MMRALTQIHIQVFSAVMPSANVPRLPRAFSVDGSMSNLNTPRSHALSRSSKDYLRPFNTDPPRPAKEGYEWVWFPEGYWAEREYQASDMSLSKALDMRLWKRKKQSRRSHSGSSHDVEPLTQRTSSFTPLSPYLSEEAHVQSLQKPRDPGADKDEDKGSSALDHAQSPTSPTAVMEVKSAGENPRRYLIRFPSFPWIRRGQTVRHTRDMGESAEPKTSDTLPEESQKLESDIKRGESTPKGQKRIRFASLP